jgi:inner membrane protein involved in colicin E2 resistance
VEALGKTSQVTINSDWAQPNFTGGFLPVNPEVAANGFTAEWQVTHLNRNFRLAAWMTLLKTGLDLFIFTILQLQDYALLAGSIRLFVILAIIMRASQKIKWYAEN